MKSFDVFLTGGQKALVDYDIDRLLEGTVRSSLRDPQVRAEGSYLIGFRLREVKRPLKPEAVTLLHVSDVSIAYNGNIVLHVGDREAGYRVYPTVPRRTDPKFVHHLIREAVASEATDRRLFFGRIHDEIKLIDAAKIERPRKGPRPDSRQSRVP